ncbi:Putative aliphatic sulfonates-binding protein precursor [Paraliobacillus sp. PM-2]|uniref:ABC transporter substrate-binding protein n=1 Tax=Paraliobacillus sp. PM-2 TaxID=1462524 RepID=UPI00061CA411|nr:ABC transporter substrate-binding protein [Paraliobacillus sp. PM-2]CQR47417.1 Putative aliphatic sulfonates-binding protein precursor [Paraliobacillus sp. PM-2]
MKKKLLMLFVLLFAAFLVVGCSGDDTTSSSGEDTNTENNDTSSDEGADEEEQELTEVKVGYMPNFASVNTVVAGMRTGAFEEEGIEVELVEFADGPTIIAALESGSIDIGYIGPGAHVLPIQGKSVIFAWSQLGNADEVIGSKEKGVNEIEDLEGKTIGVATGTSSEAILDLTLQEAGLTKDDVTLMDMDASAIVTAMISGSVDAVATWSPNTNTIKQELGDDAIMLANNERFKDEFPSIASWIVDASFAEEKSDLLERYTSGLYKASDYRVDNLDQVAEWVAEEIAVSADSVLAQTSDGIWLTEDELIEMVESGEMKALYEKQAENFVEAGRLTEDQVLPVEDYVLFDNMLNAATE